MCILLSPSAKIYLNSFKPICYTKFGIGAIVVHKIPPFVDSSCRREPDLENQAPSISAICRNGKFAPRLQKGDIVIYMTVRRGVVSSYKQGHHLVAVLQVESVYANHAIAYGYYSSLGLKIPSNCIVDGNPPCDFDKTAGDFRIDNVGALKDYLSSEGSGQRIIRKWDCAYKARTNKHSCFIKTRSLYSELHKPPVISHNSFIDIFGRIPSTRNPPSIEKHKANQLLQSAGINIHFV